MRIRVFCVLSCIQRWWFLLLLDVCRLCFWVRQEVGWHRCYNFGAMEEKGIKWRIQILYKG